MLQAVGSRPEAVNLAIVGMTLLVGLQQWRSPVTDKDFDVVFNHLEQFVAMST